MIHHQRCNLNTDMVWTLPLLLILTSVRASCYVLHVPADAGFFLGRCRPDDNKVWSCTFQLPFGKKPTSPNDVLPEPQWVTKEQVDPSYSNRWPDNTETNGMKDFPMPRVSSYDTKEWPSKFKLPPMIYLHYKQRKQLYDLFNVDFDRSPTRQDVSDSMYSRQDVSDSVPTGPDVIDSKTTDRDVIDSKSTGTDVIDSKSTGPDVIDSKINGPDVLDSKTTGPDVIESKTYSPDIIDSKTTGPDVIDSKTTGPYVIDSTNTRQYNSTITRSPYSRYRWWPTRKFSITTAPTAAIRVDRREDKYPAVDASVGPYYSSSAGVVLY